MSRTRTTLVVAIAAAGLLAACKKEEGEKAPEDKSAPATDTAAKPDEPKPDEAKPDETAGGEEPDGQPNDMKNCPNAVAGAKTEVKKDKKNVVVTITVPADKATEVVDRIKLLQTLEIKEPEEVTHTGKGTGGASGPCPIVTTMSRIAKHEVKGGTVTIFLEPLKADELQKLNDLVTERLAEFKPEGGEHQHGSGQGGGTGGGTSGGEGENQGEASAKSPSPRKPAKPKKNEDEEEGGW